MQGPERRPGLLAGLRLDPLSSRAAAQPRGDIPLPHFHPFWSSPWNLGVSQFQMLAGGLVQPSPSHIPTQGPKIKAKMAGPQGMGGLARPPGEQESSSLERGQAGQVVQKVSINPFYSCRREKKAWLLLQPGSRGFVLPLS